MSYCCYFFFFFSSRRRHTRCLSDWSSDVCSSDLYEVQRRDCVQIAGELKCDPSTARNWIRQAGIETRKRGFGHPQNLFVKGQRSMFAGRKHSTESLIKIEQATRARGGAPYLKNGVQIGRASCRERV